MVEANHLSIPVKTQFVHGIDDVFTLDGGALGVRTDLTRLTRDE